MTTRQMIRNPIAYAKAEEKRELRRQQLIDGVSCRISPIIRKKFSGVLTAPSVMMVWDILAQQGGIDPDMKRVARRLNINLQDVMKEALDLAIERKEVEMSDSDSGEVVLYIWPPIYSEEMVEFAQRSDTRDVWPALMFLGFFFADGVL